MPLHHPLKDRLSRPPPRRQALAAAAGLAGWALLGRQAAATTAACAASGTPALPLFDAHIHYSHDAWDLVPPPQAVALLRQAGLRGALVSSSNDEGTQMLAAEAPDLIVPALRPYRRRGELGSWMRDDSVVAYLESRLARHRYVAVGEFHLFGDDADLPVPRRMVALAREHGLVLHAHSDIAAIDRLLAQWPEARVLWAHSGFDAPDQVAAALRRHPRLWCDLAFRGDHAPGGQLDPAWRATFEAFPSRFMVGTDTFTPERWHFIPEHAALSRSWLTRLPAALGEAIAWRNAQALLRPGAPAKA